VQPLLTGCRIERFNSTPGNECCVLLVMLSMSSGAAGLTLTAADTAFILEPQVGVTLNATAVGGPTSQQCSLV
jgi:hypothetical protein